jgi:hypothetical protein
LRTRVGSRVAGGSLITPPPTAGASTLRLGPRFIAAESGIGRLLLSANGNMDTELLFAAILALVGAGIALFLLMEGLEKLALPWHSSQRTEDRSRSAG